MAFCKHCSGTSSTFAGPETKDVARDVPNVGMVKSETVIERINRYWNANNGARRLIRADACLGQGSIERLRLQMEKVY